MLWRERSSRSEGYEKLFKQNRKLEMLLVYNGGMQRRFMQPAASPALSCMPSRCSMAPLHLAASCYLEDHAIFIYPDGVYGIERTGSVAASSHQDITS